MLKAENSDRLNNIFVVRYFESAVGGNNRKIRFYLRDIFSYPMNPTRPPLWSSGQSFWLQIQRSRVRSPALPDFLSSSGTGSTQPREVN